MKPIIPVILVAVVLTGCGPSLQEQRAARLRALQMDLDGAYGRWEADVARSLFAQNADAVQELEARYAAVYARWGVRIDPFSQAILSYAVALARRVDRGEITRDDANRLFETMRADMQRERRRLASQPDRAQAQSGALMLQRWDAYWSQYRKNYQSSARNPVNCRILPNDTEGDSVKCD